MSTAKRTGLPLEGIRVVDLTIQTAGPNVTLLLADAGAEVIKVESARYVESMRRGRPGAFKGPRAWDFSPMYLGNNRDKYGIALDLTQPQGKELFKRLVAKSDVVVENFRTRVMRNFGLDYNVLKAVRPDIIYVSVSSQGSQGPEAEYGSSGMVLDGLSGLGALTGYPGGGPTWTAGVNYPDQTASVFGAATIVAMLRRRERTGQGGFIDYSQREFTTNLIGEFLLDFAVNGRVPERLGNGHASMAPHGCYPCRGEDAWVTIAVATDAEFQALCEVMGQPALAKEPRFADVASRWAHRDALDGVLASWTRQKDKLEVMHALQARQVPATAVFNGKDILESPHFQHRGAIELRDHPPIGLFPLKRSVPKMSRVHPQIRKRAPGLGEDTERILRDLLGVSDEELRELARAKVTDNDPLSARPSRGI